MNKPDRPLTRDEIIYLWKTEGGNYSWRKWAAMFEIPEQNPDFMKNILESLKNKPLQ